LDVVSILDVARSLSHLTSRMLRFSAAVVFQDDASLRTWPGCGGCCCCCGGVGITVRLLAVASEEEACEADPSRKLAGGPALAWVDIRATRRSTRVKVIIDEN
jgi:hypothetical protein